MGKKEVDKAKKVFKDAWDALNDFFDERHNKTVYEDDEKAHKGKVALAKLHAGMVGKTEQINFRILIGQEKELGDHIYEAVYMNDKKEPYVYHYIVDKGKPRQQILTDFKDPDWNGYKKVQKFKSLTKFLEDCYKEDIYHEGKKYKKEDALNTLIKKGLKRALEAIGDDVEANEGIESPTAKKIARVIAIAAVTTILSAALTPAAGVIISELATGGSLGGNVLGEAASAGLEGLQSLADPTNIAEKVAKKAITKGKSLRPGD